MFQADLVSNQCFNTACVALVFLLDLVLDVHVCALDVGQTQLCHSDIQPLCYHCWHIAKYCQALHYQHQLQYIMM